jgi:GTPase KRas protein
MEYKIVVLGSGSVGKSALTIRLISDHFLTEYDPTIEDSYRKMVTIDGESIVLNILDTAGQDDFVAMQDTWIREGKGFLLVYAINSPSSFNDVQSFHDKVLRTKNSSSIPMVLVGNKCDLPNSERKVTQNEGEVLAGKWGIPFYEVSAKTKIKNEECFYQVVREIKVSENKKNLKSKSSNKSSNSSRFCQIL